jgi:hypothetical protein
MSLTFIGPAGTAEHRWIVYALLRDNVQHYLEKSPGSKGDFTAIHAIAQALGGPPVMVNARQLRTQLEKGAALLGRPLADLAASQETRAVLTPSRSTADATAARQTAVEPSLVIPGLPPHVRTLDGVFGSLVRSLLDITRGASETDVVQVEDS